MTTEPRRRGEFDLIATFLEPLTDGDPRALGLTDDAAVVPQKSGLDTVVSTDTMVAGVHFLMTETPDIIARRLLRVNLSDIAAMGARPVGYFLNLTLPDSIGNDWLETFASGLAADQALFGVTLLGGDTTRTPGQLTLTVTLFGEVASGCAIRRNAARAGDLVFVSGTIGDAGLGLSGLSDGTPRGGELVKRFQLPDPRVTLGPALCGIASAMADVSDGLVADLSHICEASGCAGQIRADAVPLSAGARRALAEDGVEIARLLTGGDDYELVFTVSPDRAAAAKSAAAQANVPVSEIGVIGDGAGQGAATVVVLDANGKDISPKTGGYRHF